MVNLIEFLKTVPLVTGAIMSITALPGLLGKHLFKKYPVVNDNEYLNLLTEVANGDEKRISFVYKKYSQITNVPANVVKLIVNAKETELLTKWYSMAHEFIISTGEWFTIKNRKMFIVGKMFFYVSLIICTLLFIATATSTVIALTYSKNPGIDGMYGLIYCTISVMFAQRSQYEYQRFRAAEKICGYSAG